MKPITYVIGDATNPTRTTGEHVLIAHIVNDEGRWGRGFVVALSRVDQTPERAYRLWHAARNVPIWASSGAGAFILGNVQFASFGDTGTVTVANMIAQRGWRRGGTDPQALDLPSLKKCLTRLREHALALNARVAMPRIGCGLGGGKWSDVEPIIEQKLCAYDIDVTVYSLPNKPLED